MPASAPVIRRTLAAAFALIVAGPALAPSSADACVRPFLLGDSVLAWSASVVRRELGHSAPVVDAAACRGTVYSCVSPGQASRPASGLSTIRSQRGRLGELVVIELGYNDRPLRALDRPDPGRAAQPGREAGGLGQPERAPLGVPGHQPGPGRRRGLAGPSCASWIGARAAPVTVRGSSTASTSRPPASPPSSASSARP